MIIREWHGWTTTDNTAAYRDLICTQIMPDIAARGLPGFQGYHILRRTDPRAPKEETEFVTLLWFSDMEGPRAFVGEDGRRSNLPDAARALLSRWDTEARHWTHRAHARAPGTQAPLTLCRLWRGLTRPGTTDAYDRMLTEEIWPEIMARGLPGFRGYDVLREDLRDGAARFTSLSWYDDAQGIAGLAATEAPEGDPTIAFVPAKARAVLADYDRHVMLFAIEAGQAGLSGRTE